jgi:hypothetical protein
MRALILLLATSLPFAAVGCANDSENPGGVSADALRGDDGQGTLEAAITPPEMPDLPRYSVPVDSADLEPWSHYAVAAAGAKVKNGTITFHYPFPNFISGKQQFVELVGPFTAGQTHVDVSAGAMGTGTCDLADEIWSCHEHLPGMKVSATVARRAMTAAGMPAAQIAKRLQVTERFSVDPIGIFEMDACDVEVEDDDDDAAEIEDDDRY